MCGELKQRSGPESAGPPGAATERLSTGAAKAWLCVASATFCYLVARPRRISLLRTRTMTGSPCSISKPPAPKPEGSIRAPSRSSANSCPAGGFSADDTLGVQRLMPRVSLLQQTSWAKRKSEPAHVGTLVRTHGGARGEERRGRRDERRGVGARGYYLRVRRGGAPKPTAAAAATRQVAASVRLGGAAWSKCCLGSAPARRMCLLAARLAVLAGSALSQGRSRATGRPSTASGARARRLQSRRSHRL